VEILDHENARLRPFADIAVVGQPLFLHLAGAAVGGMHGADRRRTRIADDRRQLRPRAHERLGGVAEAPPLPRHGLERVADRRRIERGQALQFLGGQQALGHYGSPYACSMLKRIATRMVLPCSRTWKPVSVRPASTLLTASGAWLTGSTQKKSCFAGVYTTRKSSGASAVMVSGAWHSG